MKAIRLEEPRRFAYVDVADPVLRVPAWLWFERIGWASVELI